MVRLDAAGLFLSGTSEATGRLSTHTFFPLRCTGCRQRLLDLYSGQNLHVAVKCPRCKKLNHFSTVRVEVLFLQLKHPEEKGGHASLRVGAARVAGN